MDLIKTKVHNFSAGPSILAPEVIAQAAEAVKELDNIGLSLIEISHRSKQFIAIMDEAQALVKELLNIPENYSVQFLQGGASTAFYASALNFMKEGGKAAYINTGAWSKKAIKEAKLAGTIEVVASSEDQNFNYIPKGFTVPSDADYLHFTSNNTIFGTQFKDYPQVDVPLIADMSSDIFSKPIDVTPFDCIYAGAQKNLGPAGTTIYIVNKDKLGKSGRTIPSMLDLEVHDKAGSMFNTPPVFAIYTSLLTLRWLKANGGLSAMAKKNEEKAAILYNEIDSNPLFKGTAAKEDRSLMNVTFLLTNEELKAEFDQMAKEANLSGINGHRSVGGYRASIYNAMPISSVEALVDVMKEFGKKFG